jgi:hypothetical protein
MVLHAKSFGFLRGPLKLGLKYVGGPDHHPPALGMVFVYSVGPKEGLSRQVLVKGVFPLTTAHDQPMDAPVIDYVERKVKGCSGGFCCGR